MTDPRDVLFEQTVAWWDLRRPNRDVLRADAVYQAAMKTWEQQRTAALNTLRDAQWPGWDRLDCGWRVL